MPIPATPYVHAFASPTGASRVLIHRHGAQILSWNCGGMEQLYLSPAATFAPGEAIRGGIPVIFPQFGPFGPGQRHGFARLLEWAVPGDGEADNGFALILSDAQANVGTPHRFTAKLSVALPAERELQVGLEIVNTGPTELEFTCALHTYIRVSDIAEAHLHGLQGTRYLDSTKDAQSESQGAAPVHFGEEIDRIYLEAPPELILEDGMGALRIRQAGFHDTVVWNPGEALAARIADLGAGEHRYFVCVEAACIRPPIVLPPGGVWNGSQTLIR